MRVDNDGEGGILALMSLLGVKRQHRPAIVAVGLFGAALIYGDGAITPAISVLSALEGLDIATPAFAALRPSRRGRDPDRAVRDPAAGHRPDRQGIRPDHGAVVRGHRRARPLGHRAASHRCWWRSIRATGSAICSPGGLTGFLVLGGGVPVRHRRRGALCRHGPFRRPADPPGVVGARLSEPRPELCRAGGAASSKARRRRTTSSTGCARRSCSCRWCVLATVATIIASQSIITGAFSMTRQAIQLGWLPRLQITQTSGRGLRADLRRRRELAADARDARADDRLRQVRQPRGRLRHRRLGDDADDLGAAVHRDARDLALEPAAAAGAVAGAFVVVDAGFFTANLAKIADGGYVPLVCSPPRSTA